METHYRRVDASKRSPDEAGVYFTIRSGSEMAVVTFKGKGHGWANGVMQPPVIYWLEPIQSNKDYPRPDEDGGL